ncbi:MAG TPA: polymer-forming cytoskeletal protein [Myxococcota bacterium]|nr:polymer-forming cytoskeletal protein [Myxococcota bacterium]HRY92355.1 polymer-forming cytoskeletal protein [Myxococcota bacterium]
MADTNTVVGESILIKGNLEGDEDLTVQGRIEGSIHLTKTLIVEQSGVVKAEVSVANAVISGIMVGNLTATDSVEIAETGRMVGDIQAPRVIITEGASFKGRVDMGDLALPRQAGAERPKAVFKPAVAPKPMARPAPAKPAPAPARPAPAPAKPVPAPAKPAEKAASKPEAPLAEALAGASKKKVVIKKKR